MTRALNKFLDRMDRMLAFLADLCVYASAVGILGIAILLCASSIKRYLFHAPITVTEELGGLLFMATTFLAITGGFVRNRHVRLELLWRHIPTRFVPVCEFLMLLTVNFALGVLVIETWKATTMSFEFHNRSVMTEIVLWPWRMVMPFCLGLFMAIATVRCLRLLLSGFRVPPQALGADGAIAASPNAAQPGRE